MRPLAARFRLRTALRGAPLLLIILLAGCLLPPEPKTDAAKDVFGLYVVILIMAAIVFVGVEGFILYAVFRYRRAPGDDVLPVQHHGNNRIEIVWTVIPSVIVLILFGLSMVTLGTLNAKAERPGVTIDVVGFQWQWQFNYRDQDQDIENDVQLVGTAAAPPTMVVPVGEPVRLILNSNDVIHSFYVPQFLIKRDVVPFADGIDPNELEFTVSEVGTYAGQCAEFCGLAHADMTLSVQAMTREDFDSWIAQAQAGGGEAPAPSAPAGATTVAISARNIAFSTDTLEVPAGEPFVIEFTNEDSVPHDIAIFDGEEEIFNGENQLEAGTVDYQVPALEPGEYRFVCTFHAGTMIGTIVVGE